MEGVVLHGAIDGKEQKWSTRAVSHVNPAQEGATDCRAMGKSCLRRCQSKRPLIRQRAQVR